MPLPDVLVRKIDDYVDSLAPEIQPRIATELNVFQQKTIDSLEEQVIDAFRSLFNNDNQAGHGSRGGLNDSPPDAYGGQSLPFADEIASLTRNFGQISDEAGDNLRDIFNLTEGGGGPGPQARGGGNSDGFSGAKGFLSAAINVVQDHVDRNQGGGQKFQLDGLLAVISDTVKDTARNPEEKARAISPEIKEQVGAKLREQHAPIAEQFTRIALDRLKQWLHKNTSGRDVGDGAKAEIHDQVKDLVKGFGGMFGNKHHSGGDASRGVDDRDGGDQASGGGFSKVVSDKLSTGIAKVHRDVRLEFRTILGTIEKQLFEMLPDQFQRPLEKILGGNPFDAQLDRDAGMSADRGFGDDIKAKLVDKIRGLIRKVQETLRTSILGVVNGGHRKLEHESWLFVQNMVEMKVQKYLPKVKITVPDDIGNEGVKVGAPTQTLGGGPNPNQSTNPQSYSNPPNINPQSNYNPPNGNNQTHSSQGYTPQGSNNPQNYNNPQSYSNPPQSYNNPQSSGNSQGYNNPQSYHDPQSANNLQGFNNPMSSNNPQGFNNPQIYNPQSYNDPPGYSNPQDFNNPQSYHNPQGFNNPQSYHNPQHDNPQGYNPQGSNNSGYNNPHGYNNSQGYNQQNNY